MKEDPARAGRNQSAQADSPRRAIKGTNGTLHLQQPEYGQATQIAAARSNLFHL